MRRKDEARRSTSGEEGAASHRGASVLIIALALPLLAAACGATAASKTTSTIQSAATTVASTCQEVSDILSDGPDPGADPVGYAEAQVLPLRQITASDASLHRAIDRLATAYEAFFKDSGAKTAASAVTAAGNQLDKICPGATS